MARHIISLFPEDVERLVEPFAGSAAISHAAAYYNKSRTFTLNDANVPLVNLWQSIMLRPSETADRYDETWQGQFAGEKDYYNRIRDQFNRTQQPDYFLFLLTRCVKASVRYNASGEFNQSPDNRRKGTAPVTMRRNICGASQILGGRTRLCHGDYRSALEDVTPHDLIYMDPPYQGVCGNRDSRYVKGLAFDTFTVELARLNERGVSYILSYDGRTGEKRYGQPLPEGLDLTHVEIDAGRSSQATLLGKSSNTFESLYLSPALVRRLGRDEGTFVPHTAKQSALFEMAS